MNATDIQNITALGLIALFIWVVIRPLIPFILENRKKYTNNRIEKRIKDLETFREQTEENHFHEYNYRIGRLEDDMKDVKKDVENIKIELVRIKSIVNGKK